MQQQKVIQNPSKDYETKPLGPEMNARDMANDILATEKYITDSLNIMIREASNTQLHTDIKQIFNETHQMARDLYNLMFQKGWYKIEVADTQQVQQAYQQFEGYKTQLVPSSSSPMMMKQ